MNIEKKGNIEQKGISWAGLAGRCLASQWYSLLFNIHLFSIFTYTWFGTKYNFNLIIQLFKPWKELIFSSDWFKVIAILVFVAASQAYDNNRYNQYNAGYAQSNQQLKTAFPAFNFNSAQLSQQLKPDAEQQLKSAFPAFDFNSAEGKGPDSFLNVALSEAFNLNDLIKTVG